MEIYQKPQNYSQIVEALGDVSKYNPVFCYGDTIYNPFGREITPDVEHHESIHSRQQAQFTSPDDWYSRYLTDKKFRYEMELEAYSEQYSFGKEIVKKNKLTDAFLDSLASELCGEAYGLGLTFGEARSKIRNFARE